MSSFKKYWDDPIETVSKEKKKKSKYKEDEEIGGN